MLTCPHGPYLVWMRDVFGQGVIHVVADAVTKVTIFAHAIESDGQAISAVSR